MSLFKQLPPIVTSAGFVTMEPGCQIVPHHGADVGVMRCHVCIDIPDGDNCKLMVQHKPGKIDTMIQKNGEVYFFDDSPLHWAGNNNKEERTILLFDFIYDHFKAAENGIKAHIF